MAAVAKRCRLAGQTTLSHDKPRRRNPYGKSRMRGNGDEKSSETYVLFVLLFDARHF
jgi:hypothetical protein